VIRVLTFAVLSLAPAGAPREETPALDRAALVRAVLERNPSIEAARQAWQAARQREPQATALDDPMLSYSFAPLSIGSDTVNFGEVIKLSQRLPFPGTRRLRGDVAAAEAGAAQASYESVRRSVALMASVLFEEAYAVERAFEINEEHILLLEDFKRVATARYAAGLAAQQDPLQAEVEVAHLVHRRIVLTSSRDVVVAQINALLHRRPEAPFAPPPPRLLPPPPMAPLVLEALEEQALAARPELRESEASLRARRSAVALERRNFLPDFELMASYDSMWNDNDHRWMAGVGITLPVRRARIRAGVAEAEARLARAESERHGREDQVRSEVRQAVARLEEAHHVMQLYRSRLLPAASDQARAARSGFETSQNSFLALIEAERNQRTVELGYQQALADFETRRAQLDHTLGRIPGLDGSSPDAVGSVATPGFEGESR
jgi:outer membrane protein, heavy metal efflux system